MQPNKKRVTLQDLANELGLSARSVSQALSPRDSNVKLNPATVGRIQQLARERNYRPDSRARAMVSGRFNAIGYFEAKKHSDSWPLLGAESGVFDGASERHCRVTLIRLPSDPGKSQEAIPSVFREGNVDALIISHAGNLSPELEAVVDASGCPIVYLNEKKKRNAVYIDDLQSGRKLTEHIIGLGRRRIAFLSAANDASHYSVRDRRTGYKKAMEAAGLATEIIEAPEANPHWDRDLTHWLKTHPKTEAIVADSDFTSLLVFQFIRGLPFSVPGNLLVAGFGDDFGKECTPVPLTTMKIPFYEMGRAAAEMALELVEKKLESLPAQKFQSELIVRESTSGKRD